MAGWVKILLQGDAATLSDTAPVDVTKAAAAAGSASDASRQDHKHDVSTGLPVSIDESDTQQEGSATSLARSDHQHAAPSSWTPSTHATSHKSGGGDEVDLDELGNPTGAIEFNKQQATNLCLDVQASDPATPNNGQVYFNSGDSHPYVYQT